MDQQTVPGNDPGNARTLLVVAAIAGGLVSFCLLALGLYFGLIFGLSRTPAFQIVLQPTPTSTPLVNVNSVSPLGKFYFGFDGINSACQVNRPVDTFSQEDLLRKEFLYFSASFGAKDEGQSITWAVYDAQGKVVDEERTQTLELGSDLNHCAQALIALNTRTDPGTYVLDVMYQKKLAYRQIIHITYSDLAKIPRPNRPPFGKISVGRLVDTTACTVGTQSSTYSLADMKNSPWFYMVAPFQLSDIGKTVYLSVYKSNGDPVFYLAKQTIEDDIDLCFWEGFSMEDQPADKYTVVVEDEHFVEVYKTEFELK